MTNDTSGNSEMQREQREREANDAKFLKEIYEIGFTNPTEFRDTKTIDAGYENRLNAFLGIVENLAKKQSYEKLNYLSVYAQRCVNNLMEIKDKKAAEYACKFAQKMYDIFGEVVKHPLLGQYGLWGVLENKTEFHKRLLG